MRELDGNICFCGMGLLFVLAIGFIIDGTNKWKSLRDIDKWDDGQCQPKYWLQGWECCLSKDGDQQCVKHGSNSEYWREVFTIDNHCEDGTILFQNNEICRSDDYRPTWPVDSYSEEFLHTNQTEKCWTDCHRYLMQDPIKTHKKAQIKLILGYGLLFVPYVFGYLAGAFDNGDAFWMAIMNLYIIHWISVSNCTFHISGDCKTLRAGYVLYWLIPVSIIMTSYFDTLFGSLSIFFPPFVWFLSMLLLIIAAAAPPDDDFRSCFNVTFCEKQLYSTFGAYVLMLGGSLFVFFALYSKECTTHWCYHYCRSRSKTNEKKRIQKLHLNMLRDIERTWQGQKDIIFPLIDYREHIWNEIWTLCWEMEVEFFNMPLDDYELQEEIYCSDLRKATRKYKCSVDDFDFGVYGREKCCSYKSYLTMRMIAETKGQIDWKIARSEPPDLFSRYSSSFLQFVTAPHQKAYERQKKREVQELEYYPPPSYPQSEMQPTFAGAFPSAPVASQDDYGVPPPAYSTVV